jgi:GAF domain-containing protein
MSAPERFASAVAAEVLAAGGARVQLLQSIADVSRSIFLAGAASIALMDESAREFVFEAVSGEGAESLVGARFPAGEGIAGSVAQTGEPLIVDDLSRDPRFARDVAAETGYVPQALLAAPLLRGERVLGVLSVLDRGRTERSSLQELELLVVFAEQAALALDLGEHARRAADLLADGDGDLAVVARLARRLDALPASRRAAGLGLLEALDALLG